MATPIIQDLIQDITTALYEHLDGPTRYRMSMVDSNWHAFCTSKTRSIRYLKDVTIAIESLDILTILKSFVFIVRYELLFYAGKKGNLELIKILINKCGINRSETIRGACSGGHLDIINFIIQDDPELEWWNDCEYEAGEGGNMEIARLVSEEHHFNDETLFGACIGKHFDIVKYLLEDTHKTNNIEDIAATILSSACQGGSMKIIILVMTYLPGEIDWREGLCGACRGGHIDVIKIMMEKHNGSLVDAMNSVCGSGNVESMKFVLERFRRESTAADWTGWLMAACRNENSDMIEFIFDNIQDDSKIRWNSVLSEARNNPDVELIRKLINKGAVVDRGNLYFACEAGYLDIVDLMLDSLHDDSSAMWWACQANDFELANRVLNRNHDNVHTLLNSGLRGLCSRMNNNMQHLDVRIFALLAGATGCHCGLTLLDHIRKTVKK